jgi:2-polyprenyl-6-hydroxyphenyl methylase/3-demethylubiquinone-9 3-methyltransferase
LLGPVDRNASRDGVIVCHDGFRSGRTHTEEFHEFAKTLGVEAGISEVDDSSLWCELRKPNRSTTGTELVPHLEGDARP